MGLATFCHRAAAAALIAVLSTAGAACERWARPMPGTSERHVVGGGVTRTYLLIEGGELSRCPGCAIDARRYGDQASGMSTSERSLQRKLQTECVSFRDVVDPR
jgi:hypothetical protein